jgi:radical SAM superfamily enzyme YgiQ (UPF0313 family)
MLHDIKKILLVGPFNNGSLRAGQYLAPPMGIYRIKCYIEKKTYHQVDVLDVNLDGQEKFKKALMNNYDIIGFSILHPTIENDIKLIQESKKLSPDSLLILGGQGATFNHELLLKKTHANAIIKGFGELTILKILDNMNNLKKVKGIFLKEHGEIIDTGYPVKNSFQEFNEISLSFDFNKVPYDKYWSFMEKIYTKEHLQIMKNEDLLYTIRIMTSSHCPRKCSFCSSTNFFNGCIDKRFFLDAYDMANMVKDAIKKHPKCKSIYFNDDDFLFDKKRIIKLCSLLPKEISYFCLSRTDNISQELLIIMKNAGFKFIIYGVESFSEKILKDMNKGMCNNNIPVISNVIRMTIDAGIIPLMNIILFYPTTDIKDIIITIEYALSMIEIGARLTVYPYVEAYPGSSILNNGYEILSKQISINKKIINIPDIILPSNDKIKLLAKKSLVLRGLLEQQILNQYKWQGIVPHPLHGLCLFLAIYKIMSYDTERIKKIIHIIMTNEIYEQQAKINAKCKWGIVI